MSHPNAAGKGTPEEIEFVTVRRRAEPEINAWIDSHQPPPTDDELEAMWLDEQMALEDERWAVEMAESQRAADEAQERAAAILQQGLAAVINLLKTA